MDLSLFLWSRIEVRIQMSVPMKGVGFCLTQELGVITIRVRMDRAVRERTQERDNNVDHQRIACQGCWWNRTAKLRTSVLSDMDPGSCMQRRPQPKPHRTVHDKCDAAEMLRLPSLIQSAESRHNLHH